MKFPGLLNFNSALPYGLLTGSNAPFPGPRMSARQRLLLELGNLNKYKGLHNVDNLYAQRSALDLAAKGASPVNPQRGSQGFDVNSLTTNPMFMAGMGLLSANAPSLTPPNYAAGTLQGLQAATDNQATQDRLNLRRDFLDLDKRVVDMQVQEYEQSQIDRDKSEAQSQAATEARVNLASTMQPPAGIDQEQWVQFAATNPEGFDSYVKEVFKPKEPEDDKTFDREKDLRGEVNKLTKDYREQVNAYGRIQASAQDPSPAGDMALIFNFMKLLDPGSTVREGEYASAEQAGAVPDRIRNVYNRVVSGEKLTDAQRADFVSRSQMIYSEATKNYDSQVKSYTELAKRENLNPENIILFQSPYDVEQPAPRVQSGVATPQTLEEFNALPPGTPYIDPDDGQTYIKGAD